jgi:tetratricopeptide (TPR) repeat protein
MRQAAGRVLVVAVGVLGPAGPRAAAQTTNHTHYEPPPPAAAQPGPQGQLAPRLQNLGAHTFAVTTRSRRAQQFINQGLNLAYGFNHAEAGRAFKEAARLDPRCAMAYWGQALVLGPNINVPMDPSAEPAALELAQKAAALKAGASPRERAYIDALARRYSGRAEERGQRDRDYAEAMGAVARRYPADLDAAVLYAEALMDLRPWDYWLRDGTAQPGTREAVALLESVLKRNPLHPGANHLYIHLMEPTENARAAEAAADRLLPLMPGAGHMVHMPSHIYMRVGRYADAAAANEKAIAADEDYIAQCRAQGVYPLGYYPHNIHFLWWAATFQGRGTAAVEAALKTASKVPPDALKDLPFLQAFLVVPYWAWTRFGRWDDILAQAAPAADTLFARGVWHYARGRALAAKGRLDEAEAELLRLRAIVADPELPRTPATFSTNTPDGVLRVAPEVLAGDIALGRGDLPRAITHLETAVRLEDALNYTEPADWHFPVRPSLAAALQRAGRAAEAEVVYWEDLRRNPENGWALFGLAQSLRAQKKDALAAAVEERFQKAWAQADVTLTP